MSYSAEMKLLALVDREASNSGRIVKATFEMHADDAEALRGKTGKRFGVALAEIGDDEKPVEKRQNHHVRRAATLCNETGFQQFLKQAYPINWASAVTNTGESNDRAASVIRQFCNIGSRSDLATDKRAADAFDRLTAEYELWKRGE